MLKNILGKKVGMTQVFDEFGHVVPVTVVDTGSWFVTQVKTLDNDGYSSIQLGLLKKRYREKKFDLEWLKKKKKFFSRLQEVRFLSPNSEGEFKVSQEITLNDIGLDIGSLIDVVGLTRGLGFQGVVKRWGFSGGPASHGSTFHRIPGSIGNKCSCGQVEKGKKMPGHCGNEKRTVRGLRVVHLDKGTGHLFVSGAVPGKNGSFVSIRMQG